MSKSSANYIAYDLRPVKQTERRLIMDMLRLARETGLDTSRCNYIGMGGIRFYDFEMLHRYLGIKNMISLEQDKDLVPRCEFNKPLGFITIRKELSSDFIDNYPFDDPSIVWFDYDWGLSKTVTSDMSAMATKVKPGSFVFITVRAELAQEIGRRSPTERIEHFREELGQLALDCSEDDVTIDGYPQYVDRVISAAFSSAFASRTDGAFKPLLRIVYRDSMRMVTVGGIFCEPGAGTKVEKMVKRELPFLHSKPDEPYQLDDLNFTPKERLLLDLFVTSDPEADADKAVLKTLKFSKSRIDAYRRVARFLPRYVEVFM